MALRDTLQGIRLAFEGGPTPQADLSILAAHVEFLHRERRAERVVSVGDQAPPFKLASTCGQTLGMDTLLSGGPLVLVWFRGSW